MKKYCIVIEIKPERLDEYIKLHKELKTGDYRQLVEVIRESGVKEEVIFIHNNLVIIYFEADDLGKSYKYQENHEIVEKWNKMMKPLIQSTSELVSGDHDNIPTLEKVFDLNE